MPNKEFNNVQLDVTFIQAATRSNITSGEDIATSFGKISKWFTDLKSIAWDGHPTVTQKDTTSTISPNHEETFTVVDSVTRNGEGHVTGINVKTVKLPTGSGYVHPTHDPHTSGLYKITVDELGHVSDATAVTKTDITDLGIPGSDTNTTYTLSGAYGSGSNTWVTTLTPSSGSATTSIVPTASTTAYGITKLSSATNSTSTSLAATASAVKAAYDKANHSHPYLPLSGGTISSSSYGPLTIERTNSTSAAAIVFKNTNGTLGSIGMTGDINGGLFRSDGTTVHTVLDTGNLTSYTYSSTASRTANTVLAAPNGSAGAATFRTLVTADLPASGATAGSYGPSANASPAHSGTFSVPYITINAKGQVTAASTKTITLPASGNTDTKVTQTNTTTSDNYRVILSGNANDTTETATARKSANFLANPSTGEFYAKGYRRIDITGKTIDINSYNLSSGAPMMMFFIERTDGGASNITNIPVTSKPFLLDVELIRWGSSTDYITRQTFTNAAKPANSYVRYCTNGTWGAWTTRVYTDTKVNVTLGTTTKAYLLGTSTTPTSTATGVTAIADTGVYLDTTAGKLTATTFAGALSGNATTATTLKTARTINGVSFNGSENIIIPRSTKHIHTAAGTNGTSGYVKIITIKVIANYANHPVEFVISQRSRGPYHLYVQFNSVASTDPTLYEFKHFDPTNKGVNAYIVKSATSTWDIYIQKQQGYDHIYVLDVLKADGDEGGCYSITYTNTLVSSVPTTDQTKSTATIQSHTHSYLPLAGGTMDKGATIKVPTDVSNDTRYTEIGAGGIKCIVNKSGWTGGLYIYGLDATTMFAQFGGYYNSSGGYKYTFIGDSYTDPWFKIDTDGNGAFVGSVTATKLNSSLVTSTYLAGNQGKAIINSSASAGSYTMLAKMNSTNGVFTHGVYTTGYLLQYTANSTISDGTNAVTKSVRLLDESGNSSFPGTVTASAFSGNASSATKWATARNINGLSVDGTANRVNYGTCSTDAATAAKVVACTGFALVTGAEITVKFTVTNTASNPTLNVNDTGNKAIKYRGSNITAGYLAANRTYTFRYDGTNYDLVGDIDTNTNTYVTQSATTASNYRAILMGYNNSTDASTLTTTVTNQVYASSSIYAQPSTGTLYASKFSGNATSASKLATARTITLGSGLQGSVSFNGSANVTLKGSLKRCKFYDSAEDWASYPWRKIASATLAAVMSDVSITFLVTQPWVDCTMGILRAHIRTTGTVGVFNSGQFAWNFLTDKNESYLNPDNFVLVYTNNSGTSLSVEIWVKNTSRYNGYMFTVLDETTRTSFWDGWTIYTDPARAASYTSGTGKIVSSVYGIQNTTYTKLLYSGTGLSISTVISGLSSYDLFTVVVEDSATGTWEHPIICSPDNYTRCCIATSPSYQASTSTTSMLTVGIYVDTSAGTISCTSSKYVIKATSTTPTAATHSQTFAIVKVYGHKYYYHS